MRDLRQLHEVFVRLVSLVALVIDHMAVKVGDRFGKIRIAGYDERHALLGDLVLWTRHGTERIVDVCVEQYPGEVPHSEESVEAGDNHRQLPQPGTHPER